MNRALVHQTAVWVAIVGFVVMSMTGHAWATQYWYFYDSEEWTTSGTVITASDTEWLPSGWTAPCIKLTYGQSVTVISNPIPQGTVFLRLSFAMAGARGPDDPVGNSAENFSITVNGDPWENWESSEREYNHSGGYLEIAIEYTGTNPQYGLVDTVRLEHGDTSFGTDPTPTNPPEESPTPAPTQAPTGSVTATPEGTPSPAETQTPMATATPMAPKVNIQANPNRLSVSQDDIDNQRVWSRVSVTVPDGAQDAVISAALTEGSGTLQPVEGDTEGVKQYRFIPGSVPDQPETVIIEGTAKGAGGECTGRTRLHIVAKRGGSGEGSADSLDGEASSNSPLGPAGPVRKARSSTSLP